MRRTVLRSGRCWLDLGGVVGLDSVDEVEALEGDLKMAHDCPA